MVAGQKIAARRRLRELGRELILYFYGPDCVVSPQVSDDLQQRLAAFAVIGQDHESMPITAAVDNFVCEQEVPLVQLVRHIQRIRRQLLRLADGTPPGLEHG
jgi:hypothetical protein